MENQDLLVKLFKVFNSSEEHILGDKDLLLFTINKINTLSNQDLDTLNIDKHSINNSSDIQECIFILNNYFQFNVDNIEILSSNSFIISE